MDKSGKNSIDLNLLLFVTVVSYWFLGQWDLNILGVDYIYALLGTAIASFVPGILVLQLINLKSNTAEKILYSLCISLVWTMCFGALLSLISSRFGQVEPLLVDPVYKNLYVISTLSLIGLNTVFGSKHLIQLHFQTRELAYPLLLPLIATIGARYVDIFNSNIVSIFLLLLISITPIVYVFHSEKYFPLVLGSISLSLLLQNSVVDTNLKQGDAMKEFIIGQKVLTLGYWDPQAALGIGQMLRLSILHPSYKLLTGLSLYWEFKLVHPILFAFLPIALFLVYKRLLPVRWAFLTACAFMLIHPFFNLLSRNTRTGIALLFLSIGILVIVDGSISSLHRRAVLICAGFGVAVSHYGVAPMFLTVLFIIFILSKLEYRYIGRRQVNRVHASTISLIILLVSSWYIYTSKGANFSLLVGVIVEAAQSVIAEPSSAEEVSSAGSAFGIPMPSLTFKIIWTEYITVGILGAVGVLVSLFKYICASKEWEDPLGPHMSEEEVLLLFSGMGGGVILLLAFGPFGLGIARVYTIGMVFVIPYSFLIARILLTRQLSADKAVAFISALLILFTIINTGVLAATVTHDVSPQPNLDRKWISEEGSTQQQFYLYRYYVPDSDTKMTNWLMTYGNNNKLIYSSPSPEIKGTSTKIPPESSEFTIKYLPNEDCRSGDYIYLPKGVMEMGEIPDVNSLRFIYYSETVSVDTTSANTIYSSSGNIGTCSF